MGTITIRLNHEEEKLFNDYAKLNNVPLSTLMKNSLEEKIEEELDLSMVKDYEDRKSKDEIETIDHESVKKILGI